ncbi:hypothetical protein [Klebsiella pneumoniae]
MQALATEPRRALVADDHGLADIEIIIAQGKNWLKPQGWIALEHGYDQGQAVRNVFAEHGFSEIKTIQDYGQNQGSNIRTVVRKCELHILFL